MELMIGSLVSRFERGALSRRELIRGLTLLAATSAAGVGAAAQDAPAALPSGWTPTGVQVNPPGVDHYGLTVTDVARSIDFYTKVLGMTLLGEDKATGVARMGIGKKTIISLNKQETGGKVDHIAFLMDNFKEPAVLQHMKDIGVAAGRDLQAGFHVTDPDGFEVQLV